jgi:gliding motility-associated protein GldM
MKNIFFLSIWAIVVLGCNEHQAEETLPSPVIALTKMNVFYVGVNNPIMVAVPGIPNDKISLRISGGEIVKDGNNGNYIIRVNGSNKEESITTTAEINGVKKDIATYLFRVKRVPDPVAVFAGKSGEAIISRAEILIADSITAAFQNFDFYMGIKVVSFDLTMKMENNMLETKSSGSSTITKGQKGLLEKCKEGSKFYIENVKVELADGSVRKCPGVTLTVL